MPTGVAALMALAAIIAVYLCCIRPMQKDGCAIGRGALGDAELDRQVAELREELRGLRAQASHETGSAPTERAIRPGAG